MTSRSAVRARGRCRALSPAPRRRRAERGHVPGRIASCDCAAIELRCADVLDYELPLSPLILYIYNAFDEHMAPLIARAVRSTREHPRPVLVLYSNPVHHALWAEADGCRCIHIDPDYCIHRFEPAALAP